MGFDAFRLVTFTHTKPPILSRFPMIKISIYKSLLRNDNGTVFKSNNHYPLTKDMFRLYQPSLSAKPCTT